MEPELLPRTEEMEAVMRILITTREGRGDQVDLAARNYYSKGTYP